MPTDRPVNEDANALIVLTKMVARNEGYSKFRLDMYERQNREKVTNGCSLKYSKY
jgi:hypothetical protein